MLIWEFLDLPDFSGLFGLRLSHLVSLENWGGANVELDSHAWLSSWGLGPPESGVLNWINTCRPRCIPLDRFPRTLNR